MALEFKLPDIGEGIAEAEIVGWRVAVGDTVEEYQTIVEVMTDKAVVEIPAPSSGTITELRAGEGDVVPVGQVIFVLESEGAPSAAPAKEASAAPAAQATATAAPPATTAPATEAQDAPAAAPPAPLPSEAQPAAAGANGSSRVRAVPSARRLARELSIDLSLVRGTGRNGVIRSADVQAFAATPQPAAPAAPEAPAPAAAGPAVSIAPGEGQTRTPFRGIRRKIAAAMSRSKYTATHFTVVEEVDVTELVELRKKAKELGAREGVKVTYMAFIMKATASTLLRYPELNSQLDEVAQEIVTFDHVNLGIAMDTDQGLIVPVIPAAHAKSPMELARELQELAERTREGQAKPTDFGGGTFTITNAGNIGGTLATPIINFPEVAILGVHRIVKRPAVVEGPDGDRVEVRHLTNFSISVDHRLADGASGARFLVDLKHTLENPALMALSGR